MQEDFEPTVKLNGFKLNKTFDIASNFFLRSYLRNARKIPEKRTRDHSRNLISHPF